MPLTLAGATAISGGAGFLGSAFNGFMNRKAVKEANKGNLQIAQMNNQWNAEQAAIARTWQTQERDAQNAWNLEQWNRENSYNSPVAQRARLEAAGINPFNMNLAPGEAGSASSTSVGGVDTPQAQSVNQMPAAFQVDFSTVSKAINSHYQNQKLATESTGQDIANDLDRQFGPDLRLSQIAGAIDGDWSKITPGYRKFMEAAAPELAVMGLNTKRQEYLGLRLNNELTAAQAILTRLNANAQAITNKFLPANLQVQYYAHMAKAFSDYAAGRLSLGKLKTESAQYFKVLAETAGIKIQNRIADRLSKYYVDAAIEEYSANRNYYATMKYFSSEMAGLDIKNARLGYEQNQINKSIADIMKEREKDSWENNKWYRNIKGALLDIINMGTSVSGAAALTKIARIKANSLKYNTSWNKKDGSPAEYYGAF